MYYVIINPASKSGHGREIWSQLELVFKDRNIAYQSLFSKGVGHVTSVVEKLCTSHTNDTSPIKLIVLGGDGTINEVLQGIHDFSKVWIGYIPTGSSNDLARDLQLPYNPADILDIILNDKVVRTMDLGILTYEDNEEDIYNSIPQTSSTRYFAVSSGIGFDAAVCQEALTSKFKNMLNKLGLGKLTYLVIALKQLIAAKSVACDIYLDDDMEPIHYERFLFTAFMLHKYEGGGFKFCPTADANDGLLDLCVIGDLSKLIILFALPTAFWGKHYIFSSIKHYTASKVSLQSSHPLWIHTDGEVKRKASKITLSCEKEKIQLMM